MTQIVINQVKNLSEILDSLHCKTWSVGQSYALNTLVAYYNSGYIELYRVIVSNYTAADITSDLASHYIEKISSEKDLYYNNLTPTHISVGGVPEGFTFNNLSFAQICDMLFYPELFPTLTPPSATMSASVTGLREIGEIIPVIDFTTSFNRGSISPAYGTSGFRTGLPNGYYYNGVFLPPSIISTALVDYQSITNYVVTAGNQSWNCLVAYDEGEQPLSSKGNPYDSPYPSGDILTNTVTITGVYPFFGNSVSIGTMTKQPLALHNSTYFQISFVGESGELKQSAEFPTAAPAISGIQFYNTISGQWEWINGSKANSLLTFTLSFIQKNINGSLIDYRKYTHNGSTIGARQLRFYTT